MKNLKYIIASFIGLSLVSCNDYLNVKPNNALTTSTFYNTQGELDQALTGIYSELLPISKHIYSLGELRSDNTWTLIDAKQNDFMEIAHFNTTALINNSEVEKAWSDYFSIVASANQFLDKIDNVTFNVDSVKRDYIAEARFLRALAYFDLVRYFGNVPASTHTLTQVEAFKLPQSSPKEIYENIIVPDLRYATENLEMEPADYLNTTKLGRANRMAAMGLLGKVYLTMSGFPLNMTEKTDSAKYYLEKVIDYSFSSGKYWAKTIDDWNKMWIHENDNHNFLFEIQYIATDGYGNAMAPFSVSSAGTSFTPAKTIAGGHHTYVEKSLKEYFMSKDSITNTYLDKRTWGTISTQDLGSEDSTIESSNPQFIKFFENIIKRRTLGYTDMSTSISGYYMWPQNFPLLRIEDIMLMYAEIVGNTTKGRMVLNKILSRAGKSTIDSKCGADSFQTIVENERRYELAYEGIRWHDLVRKNKYINVLKNKFITNDETTNQEYAIFASRVNSTSYLYPIPQSQIDITNGLYKQNPGY